MAGIMGCPKELNVPKDTALGIDRSEDEDDYEYKFSILSMPTPKNVCLSCRPPNLTYAHAQYAKLVLVGRTRIVVLILRSTGPFCLGTSSKSLWNYPDHYYYYYYYYLVFAHWTSNGTSVLQEAW